MSRNRLNKELLDASKSKDKFILLCPIGDNLYKWQAFIKGPPDSPYEDGWFRLEFQIGQNYPIDPPKVKMITKCFHPNIHFQTGEICLDILKPQHYSPAWTLESLCRAIVNLLLNPNADSPLNCDCGNQIRHGDMLAYQTMANMYTVECAMGEDIISEVETILKHKKLI